MVPSDLERSVLQALESTGHAFETIRIDPSLADTEQFCAHYGYTLEASANTIVVASKKPVGLAVACMVLATTRLDVNRVVRKRMGARRASFATQEQLHTLTGMMVGGVTPFGLPPDLRLWIDAAVMDVPRIIVGGGSRGLKVEVSPLALLELPLAEVVEGLAHPLP